MRKNKVDVIDRSMLKKPCAVYRLDPDSDEAEGGLFKFGLMSYLEPGTLYIVSDTLKDLIHKDVNIQLVAAERPQPIRRVVLLSDIDKRIAALEDALSKNSPYVAGTSITRVMGDAPSGDPKIRWCIGLGPMQHEKMFFFGDTIELALKEAERCLILKGYIDEDSCSGS